VVDRSSISRILMLLFAELDRGHRAEHQPDVESEKSRYQNAEEATEGLTEEEDEHVEECNIVIDRTLHRLKHRPADQLRAEEGVEE